MKQQYQQLIFYVFPEYQFNGLPRRSKDGQINDLID